MEPEEEARLAIDEQLAAAGWVLQDTGSLHISAALGVAVREFPLLSGYGKADYLLYAGGKALGVVEAKPVGHTLTGVEWQSHGYVEGLPQDVPAYRRPLPFHYEATGEVTQFTNRLGPTPRATGHLCGCGIVCLKDDGLIAVVLQGAHQCRSHTGQSLGSATRTPWRASWAVRTG